MRKHTILSSLALSLALIGGVTTVAVTQAPEAAAQAQSAKSIVDAAKARQVIGETRGGYLDIAGDATQAEINAMNEINIGRKSLYTKLARERNEQLDVVATLTGEKQIEKTPPGQMVKGADGVWVMKGSGQPTGN